MNCLISQGCQSGSIGQGGPGGPGGLGDPVGPGGPSGPGGPAGQNGQVVRWFPPGWSNLNINISNMKIKYWIS